MIKFFNKHNIPHGYDNILKTIKATKNYQPNDDEVYMVLTISEPQTHVALVCAWLNDRLNEYPAYWGNLLSVAIVPHDVASVLKLSLPLS